MKSYDNERIKKIILLLCRQMLWCHDNEFNDTCHNDTRHNNTQQNVNQYNYNKKIHSQISIVLLSGTKTLSTTTFSLTTLSVTAFTITALSITNFSITKLTIVAPNTESCYAGFHLCCLLFVLSVTNKPFPLSVVMLNVIMTSDVMLNIVAPSPNTEISALDKGCRV